jgi:hypothetical protein
MIAGSVFDYVDEKGRDAGRLLALSQNLFILLQRCEGKNAQPLHRVGRRCKKCRQQIVGRNIFPSPIDSRILECACLTILYTHGDRLTHDFIISHWAALRRVKIQAEHQLSQGLS